MRTGMVSFWVSLVTILLPLSKLSGTRVYSVWATEKMRENLVKYGDKGVVADDSHHVTKYNMKLSTYVVSL